MSLNLLAKDDVVLLTILNPVGYGLAVTLAHFSTLDQRDKSIVGVLYMSSSAECGLSTLFAIVGRLVLI